MPNYPTGGRPLALLAIWGLLLCHGAFGALHLVPVPIPQPNLAGEPAAAHHTSGAPGNVASEEHPTPHHTEYFAVLLGTFLGGGLALWMLLRNGVPRATIFPVRRIMDPPRATFFNLPRSPTLTFLQVLRL